MDNDRHIGFEMRILNNLIRREIDNSNSQKYVDSLTGSNGWIIGYLAANRDRDVYQRDIEEEFSIRRSTVSKTLQIMEQKGLVRREAVERDARLKKLVLTDKALQIHEGVVKDIIELDNKMTKGLSEAELLGFFAAIDKIKFNLDPACDMQFNPGRKIK